MTQKTISTAAVLLATLTACAGDTDDTKPGDPTASTATTGDTGKDCAPGTCPDSGDSADTGTEIPFGTEVAVSYNLNLFQLGIDKDGEIAAFDVESGGDVETSSPVLFEIWGDALGTTLCVRTHDIASTKVEGGPLTFIARAEGDDPKETGETWNAWEWSLTLSDDGCRTVLTRESHESVETFLPDTIFTAVAPLAGPLGAFADEQGLSADSAGLFGIWDPGTSGATDPSGGGEFVDQRVFSALAWDGESALIPEEADERGGLADLAPGDHALQGAVLIDDGGWSFTF